MLSPITVKLVALQAFGCLRTDWAQMNSWKFNRQYRQLSRPAHKYRTIASPGPHSQSDLSLAPSARKTQCDSLWIHHLRSSSTPSRSGQSPCASGCSSMLRQAAVELASNPACYTRTTGSRTRQRESFSSFRSRDSAVIVLLFVTELRACRCPILIARLVYPTYEQIVVVKDQREVRAYVTEAFLFYGGKEVVIFGFVALWLGFS